MRYLLCVAIAAFLVMPAVAAKPSSSTSGAQWVITYTSYQNPVEQQTPGGASQTDQSRWVINPTIGPSGTGDVNTCAWDPDDFEQIALLGGPILTGQPFTVTRCLFADFEEHAIWIVSKTQGVAVSVTVTSDGGGGPYTQTVSGSHAACITAPDYGGGVNANGTITIDPELSPVTGSNGGYAAPTTITFTATSSAKRLKQADVTAGITTNPNVNCGYSSGVFGSDPYWQTGSA